MKNEILDKLERLQKYVEILKSYKNYSLEEIEKDYTLRGAIERYLQVAIECCLDIGEMIISFERLKKPETYREIIEILGKANILPEDFARKFIEAVKFRNILVHMYADIDVKIIHEILQEKIDDFNEFAKYIARYLEE
ncbi:MAG TPA: DUF86 domain-containing protein [Thermoplasmatales archaeon]|nr:DUF86 domain-containing protein [Thermoplasmatales archaeon]